MSCISAADARNIWVVTDGALHVSVASTASRLHVDEGTPTVVHWNKPRVRVDATTVLEPVENMLAHIAWCQPLDFAVAAFDSAVHTQAIPLQQLQHFSRSQGAAFREVVALVNPLADTGIETIPRVRFGRLGIVMVPQVRIDGHRVDGLIGERLILQCDGYGPHSGRAQRDRDLKQDARFVLQGYTVFRFSRDQILFDWDDVQTTTCSAIAQGLHLWPRQRGGRSLPPGER